MFPMTASQVKPGAPDDDCSNSIQMHFFKHVKATELSSQNGNNTFHWRKTPTWEQLFPALTLKMMQKNKDPSVNSGFLLQF